MAFRIDQKCAAFEAMSGTWDLVDTLLGGTKAMRAARDKYLPKEPDEESEQYEVRLGRAYLFPGLRDALRRIVARPFARAVALKGDPPKPLDAFLDDVDRAGTPLHAFARSLFRSGCRYGPVHILVDAPSFDGTPTVEEARLLNLRPYFVQISARDLFYWRHEATSDGTRQLVEIRYHYKATEKDADGNDVEVRRIRRLTRDAVETWRQSDKGEWTKESEGPNRLGHVALHSGMFCPNDGGPLSSDAPFDDLAWANLNHWQNGADQSVLMRTARFPLLFLLDIPSEADTGKPEKTRKTKVVIGPNRLTRAHAAGSDMKFVEHSGAAVGAGVKDLERIEETMVMLGLRPLVERTGDATATASAIDAARDTSDVVAWIGTVARVMRSAFAEAAEMAGVDLPADFAVEIFSDFAAGAGGTDTARALLEARKAREITSETFLSEAKRAGLLSPAVDVAREAELVADEEPKLPPPAPFGARPPVPPAPPGTPKA